jgi:hypothetical protein
MAAKTADEIHQAWINAMKSGQTAARYRAGIERFQGNPMQLAAAADNLYLSQVTDAVVSGRRAAALNAVPVTRWKNNAVTTGTQRLASGADKGAEKQRAAAVKWAPIYAQASAAAGAIPKDGTTATALQKVAAAIDVLRRAAGKT